jgi:hypothetical protein
MTLIQFSRFLTLSVLTAICLTSHAQTPPASSAANLHPIAFFTAHEWDASLPDAPDGKKRKIHAQFSWTPNGHAIRISNQMVIDGKPTPYIDGLYVWDPKQHSIVFCYAGADGGLTNGIVRLENGKLVHEFEETDKDGKTARYVARVTPIGDSGWQNEIFAKGANGLTPVVKVQYEIAK